MMNKINKQRKRYWLRGGIVGLIVYTLLTVFSFLISQLIFYIYEEAGLMIRLIASFISLPGIWASFIFFGRYNAMYSFPISKAIVSFILATIFYFIIGALLGYIYDKIKNKKQTK